MCDEPLKWPHQRVGVVNPNSKGNTKAWENFARRAPGVLTYSLGGYDMGDNRSAISLCNNTTQPMTPIFRDIPAAYHWAMDETPLQYCPKGKKMYASDSHAKQVCLRTNNDKGQTTASLCMSCEGKFVCMQIRTRGK